MIIVVNSMMIVLNILAYLGMIGGIAYLVTALIVFIKMHKQKKKLNQLDLSLDLDNKENQ